jgi:hypothetical protein
MKKRISHISTTEEAVLNYGALPPEMDGWRYYRIEYQGKAAFPYEMGYLYVPAEFDRDKFEKLLSSALRKERKNDARQAKSGA